MDSQLKREILHIFFPNRCPVCSDLLYSSDTFCEECKSKFTLYSDSFKPEHSDGYSAPFEYDENISPAIVLLKRGICGNSAYALGNALAEKLKSENISADFIVPVPMYRSDEKKRGYNQAYLIAKEVSIVLDIPICSAVKKIRRTAEQKTLGKTERLKNLENAFKVVQTVRNKRIILIDDVCTTGSTFSEISGLLKENGAEYVYCASCCKTP